MHVYCWQLIFDNFDVNASVLAPDEATAERILLKQYKGFKAKSLIFISNRILV